MGTDSHLKFLNNALEQKLGTWHSGPEKPSWKSHHASSELTSGHHELPVW